MTQASPTAVSRGQSNDDDDDRASRYALLRDSLLLDQLSGILAGTAECHDALRQVVQLLVPRVADLAIIDSVAADGVLRRAAVARATAAHMAPSVRDSAPATGDGADAMTLTVLRSGLPCLQEYCDPHAFQLLRDEQEQLPDRLQLRSYLAVPLTIRGRCLGVLTLLQTALSGRRFDGGKLAWAQQLATRLAAALEIARLEKVAREACSRQQELEVECERGRALERAVVDTVNSPAVVIDALGRMQRLNPAAQKVLGIAAGDAIGRAFWHMLPSGEQEAARVLLDAIYRDGLSREDAFHWVHRTGSRRLIRWAFTPMLGPNNAVACVAAVGDLTEDVVRQAAAEVCAERLSQVLALTTALGNSGTPDRIARVILTQARAVLGAVAGVLMLRSQDGLRLDVLDTAGYPVATPRASIPLSMPVPLVTAVRTGDAVVLQSAEECLRAGYALQAADFQLGHGAWAAVPLKERGITIGALGLSFVGPRTFRDDERKLLLLLAAQCAQALERAGLDRPMARAPLWRGLAGALTGREREVLQLLVDGLTNREIADRLCVSIDTIKTHVDHIGDKLGVAGSSRSRVLTAVRATQLGLVAASPTPGTITHVGDATSPISLPSITHVGDGGGWEEQAAWHLESRSRTSGPPPDSYRVRAQQVGAEFLLTTPR